MDSNAVAKPSGLDAAGILLVTVNLAYVIGMVTLIFVTARRKAVHFASKLHALAPGYVQKARSSAAEITIRMRLIKQSSVRRSLTHKQGRVVSPQAGNSRRRPSVMHLLALPSFGSSRSVSSDESSCDPPSSQSENAPALANP